MDYIIIVINLVHFYWLPSVTHIIELSEQLGTVVSTGSEIAKHVIVKPILSLYYCEFADNTELESL